MEDLGLHKNGRKIQNIIGNIYGKLTVISHIKGENWLCQCSCGGEAKSFNYSSLKGGLIKSCGCIDGEYHGLSKMPEYFVWKSMRQRCNNPKAKRYSDYGGRGIKVCNRWDKYSAFITDMGNRPSDRHTLERIDNNKDYCPENCYWATYDEQSKNKRNNRYITYKNETKCITHLAKEFNINQGTLSERLRRGWDIEKALTCPVQKQREKISVKER